MRLYLLWLFTQYNNIYSQSLPFHLRGTNPAKKCEMYADVMGSAVFESNICYICEKPPLNNTYNTVTKLCSNGDSPFIYFSIYIP